MVVICCIDLDGAGCNCLTDDSSSNFTYVLGVVEQLVRICYGWHSLRTCIMY